MARHKDSNWALPDETNSYDQAHLAVLMDIRDELKRLNSLVGYSNAIEIPSILREIRRKLLTPKPRRWKK